MNWLNNKRVLLTGGTGAFGKKFIQFSQNLGLAKLLILSRDEMKHAALRRQLSDNPNVRQIIGDILDKELLLQLTAEVDCIIHAAAMKHLGEVEQNVLSSTQVNVIGTSNVVHAFQRSPSASTLIFLSTDKAPYASSAMMYRFTL